MKMKPEWKEEIPSKLSEWYGKDEYYLYVKLLMNAGLRPSESAALTWGDISQEPIEINGEMFGTINVPIITMKTMDGITDTQPNFESDIRTALVSWHLIEEICSTNFTLLKLFCPSRANASEGYKQYSAL